MVDRASASQHPACFGHRRARGLLTLEVALALALVVAMLVVLSSAASYHRRGLRHLSEQRALVHRAEHALLALQRGQAIETAKADEPVAKLTWSVNVQPLDGRSSSDGITGHRWVRVTVQRGEQSATLVGLVPVTATGAGPLAEDFGTAEATGPNPEEPTP